MDDSTDDHQKIKLEDVFKTGLGFFVSIEGTIPEDTHEFDLGYRYYSSIGAIYKEGNFTGSDLVSRATTAEAFSSGLFRRRYWVYPEYLDKHPYEYRSVSPATNTLIERGKRYINRLGFEVVITSVRANKFEVIGNDGLVYLLDGRVVTRDPRVGKSVFDLTHEILSPTVVATEEPDVETDCERTKDIFDVMENAALFLHSAKEQGFKASVTIEN